MKRFARDWVLDDSDPKHQPLGTKLGAGWVTINEAHGGADVEVHYCEPNAKLYVPLELLRALIAAHDARKAVP